MSVDLEAIDRNIFGDNAPELPADALDAICDLISEVEDLRANPRDEYHTMDELYDYRMLYNALAANAMPESSCKSWRHSDGEECFGGGWFVVYLMLPTGQVSNHYKAEYWDLFRVPEVDRAPEWDGHTPQRAADRMRMFLAMPTTFGQAMLGDAEAEVRQLRATIDAMPQPIAWMTARLWDDYSWPGDGEWTIRQPTYKSEDAARADAGNGGVVVALVPVGDTHA